jgi:adenylate kinase family enzyme
VDRIAIMGCGGSGKSRLARELGTRLGITPVHLDARYYDQDWKPLDQEAFADLQRDLVAAPRWIIDGNYASTLPIRLQDHLELRPLHHRLPQDDGTSRPVPDRRARKRRPGRHPAQPPGRQPLPGHGARHIPGPNGRQS